MSKILLSLALPLLIILMETQFITDAQGNRVSVILPVEVYHKMIEELEELDDVRLYDQAKAQPSDPVSAEEAFQRIDQQRPS